MSDTKYAIEIKNRETAEVAYAIDPTLRELDYENDLHLAFLVLGFGSGHIAIMPAETFNDHFDTIENGPVVTLKRLIRK